MKFLALAALVAMISNGSAGPNLHAVGKRLPISRRFAFSTHAGKVFGTHTGATEIALRYSRFS
jgi:hypothetical protein